MDLNLNKPAISHIALKILLLPSSESVGVKVRLPVQPGLPPGLWLVGRVVLHVRAGLHHSPSSFPHRQQLADSG